jgi:dethiobiotin synthetase
MTPLVVTGTGTGVGKTVVAAAVAALARVAGRRVAYLKVAQTGVPGDVPDVDVLRRLVGAVETREGARFPDPLSPEAAARHAGRPPVDLAAVRATAAKLAATYDLVLLEGAGGLLVRFDPTGATLADLAASLAAGVLVVTGAGLGTLNTSALTLEAMAKRGLRLDGLVIGAWPADPGLAERSNLADLAAIAGQPLAGALPAGAGALDRTEFLAAARGGLASRYGGDFRADPPVPGAPHAMTLD